MATTLTSLANMSVNEQSGANNYLLMPKLKFKFRVTFNKFGSPSSTSSVILTRQVVDVTRPKVRFEEVTMDVYNSKVYVLGKHSFDSITLTLRDDVQGGVQKMVGGQLQKQFDFMEQASAATASNYKFTMFVEVLDGGNGAIDPVVLDSFELLGCMVTEVDYGDLKYEANEAVTLGLTIRFDNVIQHQSDAKSAVGIGETGARIAYDASSANNATGYVATK